MKERGITALDAGGLMTDDVLARIAALDHVTSTLKCGTQCGSCRPEVRAIVFATAKAAA